MERYHMMQKNNWDPNIFLFSPFGVMEAVHTVKVSVRGSEGKGSYNWLLFLTDRPFVCTESEAAAWPLLLHANEISTAAVSVLSIIIVTAAGWPALCRRYSPSLKTQASAIYRNAELLHSEGR